jgi:hypothetical protein
MSRIASHEFEPVEATPRRSATKSRRDAVIARDGPLCAGKGCSELGRELDHRVPLELGGADELANWQLLCRAHHAGKTLCDLVAIAKARRLRKRADGTRRPRKRIASPAHPWPPKSPKIKSRGFR